MLDHVGSVALEVNRHGLDAGDGAQTRHGVDHAADLLERGARGEDLVDQLGVGTRGAFAGEDLRDEVLRGDVEAGAFDGLAARNDHPFSFGVLLNREIVADLVLPGVGGGELAVREGELFFSDAGLVKVLEKLVGTPGEVGAFEVDRAGGIDLALGSFGREERVAVEVGRVELECRGAGERELGTDLIGVGAGGRIRGRAAEGHLGVFTEHDGRADFKDEVRSGLGGRRVGLDLVSHGRGDVETEVTGFSRQRAVDLVGLVDDDVGALDVERAVAEREGADFNAGFAFDVQRLGAHGLSNGIELDGAAVFFRLVAAFACAFTAGHDLRRGGLDGGRGKRDRADGDVAALDRLGGVGVRDVLDCKLVGFSLDGIVVGLLERLKLLFVHLAEELFKLRGVVVLRPVFEPELGDVDVFSTGVREVVDSPDRSADEARERCNLDGRRHLEGRRIEREAAERQGRRIAMVAEVGNLVVFNLELGVVVDRDGAELGDIPRTLIFRVDIAFGAGLGSGGFCFPFGLVAGERDRALVVVAIGSDLAVVTLLEGLSLAEGEGGAGGEVLVFGLGEVERAAVSEGAHDEALVDGELAAFIERDLAVGHADARLVVFAFLLVGFGLELVALVFVRQGGVRERDVAHDDGGGGGFKIGRLVEAVDRQIVVDLERARVDEGAGDRDRLVGFERAVVDVVSLPAVLSSVPLPIVIVLWLASVPSPIVTVPEAFVNLSSNFLAQASSQVCSFWTVPATVLSVVLSAVPMVSSTFVLASSVSPAMAPAEKTASVVRTAATSGFLEKVALLIDLSFVDDPGVVHEWQIPARIPKTGVGKSASLGSP